MLIICAGSDTYRAREKARELEIGFKQKYDPEGLAVEKVLINIKEHVKDRLYPLFSVGSLFSTRKFIRADGCLAIFKAVDRKKCFKRLSEIGEQTIVITVEEDSPSKKALEAFTKESVVVYSHPIMKTKEFLSWVVDQGEKIGVGKELSEEVATLANGDSWLAMTELQKFAAYPERRIDSALFQKEEAKIFEISDVALQEKLGWRTRIADFKDEGVVTTALMQLRSYARVKSGNADGVHPYVKQKLSRMTINNFHKKFMSFMRAFVSRRKGLVEGDEYETLL